MPSGGVVIFIHRDITRFMRTYSVDGAYIIFRISIYCYIDCE